MAEILTVGHSTRPLAEFLALLEAHGVERLIDVRTIPRSRRHPQFNRELLPAGLGQAGIAYEHMPGLGGLRKPRPDSANTGWRNGSFRGYADYMQSREFTEALDALMRAAESARVAIMCAESVPCRCHRSLIADALTARGITVRHIMSAAHADPHTMTEFALVVDGQVTYPVGGQQRLF